MGSRPINPPSILDQRALFFCKHDFCEIHSFPPLDMVKQGIPIARRMEKPLVCITLRGRSVAEMVKDSSKAVEMGADLLEVRLDNLWSSEETNPNSAESKNDSEEAQMEVNLSIMSFEEVDFSDCIREISESVESPLLFTCRSQNHGGLFPGSEDERVEVIRSAIGAEPDWIDLEVDISSSHRDDLLELASGKTKVIASLHSMAETPSPSEIVQDVIDAEKMGEIVKACFATKDRKDALKIFEAAMELKSSNQKLTLMGLGPGGDWVRIHSPILDQHIVYATTESGWHLSQQGRINASDLKVAWDLLGY